MTQPRVVIRLIPDRPRLKWKRPGPIFLLFALITCVELARMTHTIQLPPIIDWLLGPDGIPPVHNIFHGPTRIA